MPKYPENLIHFCRPVLEHYELEDEMGRMFVRSMRALSEVVLVYLMGQGMLVRSTAKGAHLATLDPPLKTRLAGC